MKKQVTEYTDYDEIYNFEGSFDDIEKYIAECRQSGWEGTYVTYSKYNDQKMIVLYKRRKETDQEYKKRLTDEKQSWIMKENEKEQRRKLYEELKKEFEG